jgi:putative Mn2+ efflux pump MntP
MMLKLIALVLPMGLDTFAVSLTLGLGGVSVPQRRRASLVFMAFGDRVREGVEPLAGVALAVLGPALVVLKLVS